MSKCPKCEETISIMAHDVKVYGVESDLKALYCSKCMTIITIIPVKVDNKEKKEENQPDIRFV